MRLDAVDDAVDAGHQLRSEREVRVTRGVGGAELEALGLRVGSGDRDAHSCRTVTGRVHQVDRSLVALDQTLVGVERRVGECENSRSVGEQATDVPPSGVGELCVAGLVVEEGLALEPQRLMGVHTRAVVAEQRLGHEGRNLAPLLSHVLDDVLELQDVVGGVNHRVELVVDFLLATGTDLVVGALKLEARLDQPQRDVVTQVSRLVDGGDGEVAALVRGLVSEVAALFFAARVPGTFGGVHGVEARVLLHLVAHVVEDVELSLRCKVRGVRDAG